MKINLLIFLLITIFILFIFSCSKDYSPIGPDIRIPHQIIPSTKSLLQGVWKNVQTDHVIVYVTYDSVTSIFSEKRNYGYNFRSELTNYSKVDSSIIFWSVGDGNYDPWYWLRWSVRHDTLILSYDSSFAYIMKFVKDSTSPNIINWIENLTPVWLSSYPSVTSSVRALAYSDSNWFVLTGNGSMDGELHKLRIGTSDKTTYAYPAARAMDVANGYLWLSGNFFIEKRSLVDMSLIDRYDISQYFTGHGGNNWIESITVSSDKIYLMCSWGRLLLLSTDGIVLEEYATYIGLDDMMIANGRMWGVINTDTIYEIDPTTFQAIDTYYLAGNVIISRFQGIAYRDGKIACADFVHNSLRIFQVIMP